MPSHPRLRLVRRHDRVHTAGDTLVTASLHTGDGCYGAPGILRSWGLKCSHRELTPTRRKPRWTAK
eukprot:3206749-Prymnesium_polylepis.1